MSSDLSFLLAGCAAFALSLTPPLAAQAAPTRVATVLDLDSPRFQPLVEVRGSTPAFFVYGRCSSP